MTTASTHARDARLMREEFAFQRRQEAKRRARIVAVARGNIGLPLWALAERFAMTTQALGRLLMDEGVPYETNDGFWLGTHDKRSA